eukprot:TRINITY_DN3858_c1_g2_i3.p3 TRINITY_DN3858_c1_g2~~TRINITY_DN3858_c1_g2_i3.p3  ORF type:complete len:161 (-),score=15.41 TRINITY_DN3858_c1_g2_i3:137-619(-)
MLEAVAKHAQLVRNSQSFSGSRHVSFQKLKRTTIKHKSLDSASTIAVTQQAAAYAAVIAAEAFFTRSQMADDNPGRPSIIPVGVSLVAIFASLGLLQIETTQSTACIIGLVTSVALFALYIRRISVTKGSPEDWPGPKVWPGTMTLISFFAINVYFQALK